MESKERGEPMTTCERIGQHLYLEPYVFCARCLQVNPNMLVANQPRKS